MYNKFIYSKHIHIFFILLSCFFLTSCLQEEIEENPPEETEYSFLTIDGDGCNVLSGHINENFSLSNSECWKLSGNTFVDNGVELYIGQGVTISAIDNSEPTFLSILQGGKIFAEGSQENPIIFTSFSQVKGSWGGLIINGSAITNTVTGPIEGNGTTGIFGGDNPYDNSGILRYIRVEYSGEPVDGISTEGLMLNAVGSGTEVNFIQVNDNLSDGIEINGGNVVVNHLVVNNNNGDAVDIDNGGWTGTGSFWYIQQEGDYKDGIEVDNSEVDETLTPVAFPILSNVTLIADGDQTAIKVRRGAKISLDNIYIDSFSEGVEIEGLLSNQFFEIGESIISNLNIINTETLLIVDNPNIESIISNSLNASANGCNADYGQGWMQGWTKN